MRKTIPSILIALILVNLFAPFTVNINSANNWVKKSTAEAAPGLGVKAKQLKATENSINIEFRITRYKKTEWHGLLYMITDKSGVTISEKLDGKPRAAMSEELYKIFYEKEGRDSLQKDFYTPPSGATVLMDEEVDIATDDTDEIQIVPITISTGLKPKTDYFLHLAAFSFNNAADDDDPLVMETDIPLHTADVGQVDDQAVDLLSVTAGDGDMPSCVWGLIHVSISGCIAQLLYTLFFRPTSFLFGLAGTFFDWSFDYSVKDTSYKVAFVTEGWGIVRDFVNLFFIFVLLWIAFSTVLNLHGFKTKEMIINVVIIGLLINFSLFMTQVIIDTSNITARVFYNSNNIKLTDSKGKDIAPEPGKPLRISEVIVSKVNPQRIIMEASSVGDIKDKGGAGDSARSKKGVSNGTFILVTILASIINMVGFFVFLTVGLIFIARVIGLWLAMILVPLAFFSYTVPQMQDINMIGWKKWWPNTLKLAFLAPIFIFFMYLIIKFLGTMGKTLADTLGLHGESGPEFVIAIIVPFIFIMVLLNRAKKIATDFAGEIGAAVTKAAIVGGGALVGGAALASGGIAAIGRGIISNPLKMAQSSQTTRDAAIDKFKKQWYNPKTYGKAISAKMANVGLGVKTVKTKSVQVDPKTGKNKVVTKRTNVVGNTWLKQRIDKNKKEKTEKSDKTHAEHVLNEHADKIQKGKKYSELDQGDQEKARKSANKAEVAKFLFNGKDVSKLSAGESAMINRAVDDTTGKVNQNVFDNYAKNLGKDPTKFHDAEHLEKTYNKVPSYNLRNDMLNMATKGTMDLRDMNHNAITALGLAAAVFTGGATALIGAGLAAHTSGLMRTGLKKISGGMDHGASQKDFLKDLKATLGDTLKHIEVHTKIKVKDAHGGGDDHKEDKGHSDKGAHH